MTHGEEAPKVLEHIHLNGETARNCPWTSSDQVTDRCPAASTRRDVRALES
jgi:hypothetical protein